VSKQAFDRKLAAIEALRAEPASAAREEQLRKALKDRNNFVVSKAAALAGQLGLTALTPHLVAAFDRFLENSAKTDSQCWAKNAIVKALKDLGYDDPDVFLRGSAHVQKEAVWGGMVDTAATLRGTCALALVACTLDRLSILTRLVDLLADPEKTVRTDAARAIAQLPGHDSVLLLRLKTHAGDAEAEVTGTCFDALLEMSPRDSIPFVTRFLESKNEDVRLEAVAALGERPEPEAVDALKQCYEARVDPEMKTAILRSLGASRQPAAAEFLLSIAADGPAAQAATAIVALASGRFRNELVPRVEAAIAARSEAQVKTAFQREFGA
jgi:HEAT repeat protein